MWSYILFNTLIYGTIAFGLSACFAYGKYLNIALGSFMVFGTYSVSNILRHGRGWENVAVLCGALLAYLGVNYILIHYFPDEKKRDLIGIIFTLGAAHLVENITSLIYGSNPISIYIGKAPLRGVVIVLVLINVLIYYIFSKSYLGTLWKGVYTNTSSVRALGVNTYKMIQNFLIIYFPVLIGLGVFIANESSLRPSDNLFYLIKGLGIMIMVGLDKREYVYAAAFLYVALEYLLFIQLQLPIEYKETFILIIILAVLLFRPEGLISIKGRKV